MPEVDVTKLPDLSDLTGPLASRVYTAIKSAILDLDFLPGDLIRKSEVCDHLGLSRSPVSEALAKLSNEGLVDIVPQSGTRVSRLSMASIREDSFLREALEVAAVRHAALHRSQETLARLVRNLEMQKLLINDVDKDDFIRTDVAFHEIIMATTQIKRLPATIQNVSRHLDRARLLPLPEPGRLEETVNEHVEILEAIREQDAVAAQDAMRRHVRQLVVRLGPLETERSDLFST
ncbi:MAG: GntR family transcriptional regulator [Rhizobiaceae bacterium]